MNRAKAVTSILSTACMTLLGLGAATVPTPAFATDATHCISVESGGLTGQRLVNNCNQEVEVVWCHFAHNNCVRYDNAWTIGAGGSYPIEKGRVWFGACPGANSVRKASGTQFYCE